MNFSLITRCFLTLLITCILSLQATPIIDDFEGFSSGTLNGQGDWSVLSGSADVTSDDAQGGVQSVKLYGGTSALIQRDLSTFNDNPIFADLYVKMVALEGTPGEILSLDQSTLWFIKENGQGIYHVLDGDGAGGPGTSFSVPPSFTLDTNDRVAEWVRLTFRQDFLSGKWDLSINGQLAAINLGFADVASASLALNVYGDATTDTYLDTLTYGDQNPLFTDTDKDGMPDTWETAEGTDPNIDDRDGDLEPDGLTNLEEYLHGAKPLLSDSDLDGANDLSEILAQSDPNDAESYPAGHTPPPVGNLYLYEPFAYPAGSNDYTPVNSIGLTGTINLGYATDAFVADSITYGNLEVNGGAFAKTNNPYWNENSLNLNWNSDLNDRINLSTTDTETLWMSLTVKTPADLNNKSLLLTYFGWGTTYGLEIDSTTNEARAYVGTTSASARTLNPDTNYLYIAKLTIDKSTGTKQVAIDHWVYEDGETLPTGDLGAPHASIAPTPLTTDWGISSLNLSYRTPGNPGATLEPYTLDELRLGSTPDIVLPGAYTQIPQAAAPSITPESGSYDYFVQVEITTNETGGTLHYTTDGTDPDETSPQYTGPIILTNPTTLKAICIKDGMTTSGIARADYTIKTGDLHLYEPFDYPANTHSNVPATGIGLTGNLELGRVTDGILADSINVATLQTTGNHLSITNNPYWTDSGISLTWDTPFNERINLHNSSSEEMWISFTTQTPADLDGKSLSLKFFGWGDHYGIDIDNDTNQARLFIQAGGTKHTATARTLNPNTNYLHLIRLRLDNTTGPKTITLDHWIYEDAEPLPANQAALPPPHASLSQPLVTDWGVSKLYAEYRTPAAPNASLDPYTLDELRIATDYNTAAPGTHIDTDGDGMTDTWEIFHGFDPYDPTNGTADEDSDGDGLTNQEELELSTDPNAFDLLPPVITVSSIPTIPVVEISPLGSPLISSLLLVGSSITHFINGDFAIVTIEPDPAQRELYFDEDDNLLPFSQHRNIRYTTHPTEDMVLVYFVPDFATYTGPFILNSSATVRSRLSYPIPNGRILSDITESGTIQINPPSTTPDEIIAYEGFDYPVNTTLNDLDISMGDTIPFGFDDFWASSSSGTVEDIPEGSLNFSQILRTGNHLYGRAGVSHIIPFSQDTIDALTPALPTEHTSWWMSFVLQSPTTLGQTGGIDIGINLINSNGDEIFGGYEQTAIDLFGVYLSGLTSFANYDWKPSTNYLILAKFTMQGTEPDGSTIQQAGVTVWIYENDVDTLPITDPSLTLENNGYHNAVGEPDFGNDIAGISIDTITEARLDEIRIGTTYDSVVLNVIEPIEIIDVNKSSDSVDLVVSYPNSGLQGIQIERSSDGVNWDSFTPVQIPVTSSTGVNGFVEYTDENLSPETTYYYRAASYYDNLLTDYADVLEVTTNSTTPIVTPTDLEAFGYSTQDVRIAWTPSSDSGITYHLIRILSSQETSVGHFDLQNVEHIENSQFVIIDSGLAPDTTYTYRLDSYKNGNTSSISTTAQTYPSSSNEFQPLEAPSNVDVQAIGDQDVQLDWVDNSSYENGFIVERSIEYEQNGEITNDGWSQISLVAANTTTYTDNSLTTINQEGVYNVEYRVRAFKAVTTPTSSTVNVYSDYAQSPIVTYTWTSIGTPIVSVPGDSNSTNEPYIFLKLPDNLEGELIATASVGGHFAIQNSYPDGNLIYTSLTAYQYANDRDPIIIDHTYNTTAQTGEPNSSPASPLQGITTEGHVWTIDAVYAPTTYNPEALLGGALDLIRDGSGYDVYRTRSGAHIVRPVTYFAAPNYDDNTPYTIDSIETPVAIPVGNQGNLSDLGSDLSTTFATWQTTSTINPDTIDFDTNSIGAPSSVPISTFEVYPRTTLYGDTSANKQYRLLLSYRNKRIELTREHNNSTTTIAAINSTNIASTTAGINDRGSAFIRLPGEDQWLNYYIPASTNGYISLSEDILKIGLLPSGKDILLVQTQTGEKQARIWAENENADGYWETVNLGDDDNLPSDAEIIAMGDDGSLILSADVLGNTNEKKIYYGFAPVVDLDVDSDNTNGKEQPARTQTEEQIEDSGIGKIVPVNNFDEDYDTIPDYVDGYGATVSNDYPTKHYKRIHNPDSSSSSGGFTPVVFDIASNTINQHTRFRFTYSSSDPVLSVRQFPVLDTLENKTSWNGFIYDLAPGELRLWSKNKDETRNSQSIENSGDYIPSNAEFDISNLLTITVGDKTQAFVYAEGIRPSTSAGGTVLTLQVKLAEDIPWVDADSVNLTVVDLDFVPSANPNESFYGFDNYTNPYHPTLSIVMGEEFDNYKTFKVILTPQIQGEHDFIFESLYEYAQISIGEDTYVNNNRVHILGGSNSSVPTGASNNFNPSELWGMPSDNPEYYMQGMNALVLQERKPTMGVIRFRLTDGIFPREDTRNDGDVVADHLDLDQLKNDLNRMYAAAGIYWSEISYVDTSGLDELSPRGFVQGSSDGVVSCNYSSTIDLVDNNAADDIFISQVVNAALNNDPNSSRFTKICVLFEYIRGANGYTFLQSRFFYAKTATGSSLTAANAIAHEAGHTLDLGERYALTNSTHRADDLEDDNVMSNGDGEMLRVDQWETIQLYFRDNL